MNKTKETVGDRLRALREKYKGRGVTAKVLAEAAGITPMQLNNMENDKVKTLSHDALAKIARFLGSTVEWIETGKGEMLPDGLIEVSRPENELGDPYRDYAIKRLEREVEREEAATKTWQEKYDQLWEMFSRVTANSFHLPVREAV